MSVLATLLVLAADNLFANPDFQNGFSGWSLGSVGAQQLRVADGYVEARSGEGGATNPWDIALTQSIPRAIARGERLRFTFEGRSADGGRARMMIQQSSSPYFTLGGSDIRLTNAWTPYSLEAAALSAYNAGALQAGLHLNYGKATAQIRGMKLEVLPPSPRHDPPKPLNVLGDFSQWRKVGTQNTEREGVFRSAFDFQPTDQPWSRSVGVALNGPIAANDTVEVTFEARSRMGSRITTILEMATEPHTKYLTQPTKLPVDWKKFRYATRFPEGFAAGQAQLTFFLGYAPGEVDLRNVRVVNHGNLDPDTIPQTIEYYVTPRPGAEFWRAAEQRIRQHRMANLTVRVLDKNGRPVPNAKVRVEQQAHKFRFGTAAPAERILGTTPDDERYRRELKRLFNTVTFENDLKWPQSTPEGLERVDRALAWLKANGLDARGHVVVWGSPGNLPGGLWEKSDAEIRTLLNQRVDSIMARTKGKLYLWDVVNEAVTEEELWERLGWDAFADMYKRARAADPNVLLAYNDYNITEEAQAGQSHKNVAKDRIQKLIDRNAPFDVIGIQGHVGVPMTTADRVHAILNEMAAYGKRLEITEYDLGVRDDAVHAEHMKDFMTACFAHPAMDAFILWGFWEGAHWRAREGGHLFRLDWTERPTVKAYLDLVKGKWWTRADAKVGQPLRVFKGKHRVTVTSGNATATAMVDVEKDGSVTVQLR